MKSLPSAQDDVWQDKLQEAAAYYQEINASWNILIEQIMAEIGDDSPYDADSGDLLPRSLGDAIEAFDRSSLYREALGSEFVDYLVGLKASEWRRFLSTVTDWEHKEYFEMY